MLTWTPDNSASFYTCGLCGISTQVLVRATDPDTGALLVYDDGSPVLVNDEPTASSEMDDHMVQDHPDAL